MKIRSILVMCVLALSTNAIADIIIDEERIRAINDEISEAVKDKDISVIKKYMYPDSKIVIDMDPDNNRGEIEIGYDKYIKLTEMGLQVMSEAEIHDEVLSISIDKEKNQGTIEAKSIVVVTMMGMKMEDISINKTTYGVVNGEIKMLSTQDQLISSGAIE